MAGFFCILIKFICREAIRRIVFLDELLVEIILILRRIDYEEI